MLLAPDASLERRSARRGHDRGHATSFASCGSLPTVFSGRHVRQPVVRVLRARRGRASSATRPFTVYADGEAIAELPVDDPRAPTRRPDDRAAMTLLGAKIAAARAVGELARRAGRGGGTSLPGKVLIALEPGAIGELSARLPRGSVVISATNGKTTTAAMVASVLGRAGVTVVHNRAGREHGRRRRLDAARSRPRRRADRRRARTVRGRRVLARPDHPRAQAARRSCSATCSATSSTASASSRRSPTAGPQWPRRPAARRGSSSTPTTR